MTYVKQSVNYITVILYYLPLLLLHLWFYNTKSYVLNIKSPIPPSPPPILRISNSREIYGV